MNELLADSNCRAARARPFDLRIGGLHPLTTVRLLSTIQNALVGECFGDFSLSDLDRARFGSTSGFRQFGTCQNVIGQFGRDASRSLPFPHKAPSRSLANFAGKVVPIDSYIFTASPSRARALVASPAPLRSSSIAANHPRAVGCRCSVGRGIHLLDGSEVMVLGRRPVSHAGRCDAGYSATCHVTAHDPGAREQQLFGERPQRSRIFLPSHRRQTKDRILQRNPCPHRVQLPRNRKLPAPVCPGAGCAVSLALGKNCEAERIKGSGNKGLPFHSGWIRTLGPVNTYRTAATGADFFEVKERGAQCTRRTSATRDAEIGKIRPVPSGCG